MSGDEGEFWHDVKASIKATKAKFGVPCPECVTKLPKAGPTILLPQQRCRIHGYVDRRERTEENSVPFDRKNPKE